MIDSLFCKNYAKAEKYLNPMISNIYKKNDFLIYELFFTILCILSNNLRFERQQNDCF
jgi:hypothetical protein